ncbi:hypothetical protein [Roseomonas chloroacetimidivorans]|uniref:hypothetical protein n=1 Tax=Roseomonas chloroacetimidivorans TaxID=1766656 RepID=UPI003C796C39
MHRPPRRPARTPRWAWRLLRQQRITAAIYVSAGFGRATAATRSLDAQDRFNQADLC